MAQAGIQSEINVESSPTVQGAVTTPSTWAFIWFGVSVLVILGFHIRLFGHVLPPSAHFP